jgi:hypothetical protein
MIPVASKRRGQPAPPFIIAPMLAEPNKYPTHPWMTLLAGEEWPTVLRARKPEYVLWSSLWPDFTGVEVQFELAATAGGGTDLRWTLLAPGPLAVEAVAGVRHRINYLINAELRLSFG